MREAIPVTTADVFNKFGKQTDQVVGGGGGLQIMQ